MSTATVRNQVGLFDVSHMGEIRVKGPKALETLQWTTTNDVSKLQAGQAQYSLLPNSDGGLVDDLIVYCVTPNEEYFLCVNASNSDKDFAHLVANNRGAELTNESTAWGQIAVQGPMALELLGRVISKEIASMPSFTFREFSFSGTNVIVARTGYTGEEGAEVFVPSAQNRCSLESADGKRRGPRRETDRARCPRHSSHRDEVQSVRA